MTPSVASGSASDESARLSFRANGFLSPVTAMPDSEAQTLRSRIEELEARSHGRLSPLVRTKPHLLIPFLWDVVHDPRILSVVSNLLGPDLYCLGSSIIDKPVGSEGYVAWHQDATFWGLSEADGATAWLALSPATLASGCMEVLPGTHDRQRDHFDTEDSRNMLGAREAVSLPIDHARAQPLCLSPGQMSLHHPLVLHGSRQNGAKDRRLGFVTRYVPATVCQQGGTVTLVQGRNLAEMPLEIAPEGELHPNAMKRHADIIRRAGNVIRSAKQAHLARSAVNTESGS